MTERPEYYDIPPGWDSPEAYWAWKESRQEACFHAGLAGLDVTRDAHYTDFRPTGSENDERETLMGAPSHSTEVKTESEGVTTTTSVTPDEASTDTSGESTADSTEETTDGAADDGSSDEANDSNDSTAGDSSE